MPKIKKIFTKTNFGYVVYYSGATYKEDTPMQIAITEDLEKFRPNMLNELSEKELKELETKKVVTIEIESL